MKGGKAELRAQAEWIPQGRRSSELSEQPAQQVPRKNRAILNPWLHI